MKERTCSGCKYFAQCGSTIRTEPCKGKEVAEKEYVLGIVNEYLNWECATRIQGNELPKIIDLAGSITENERHEVVVKFNTETLQWEYYIDNELVSTKQRKSLLEFADELEGYDFGDIIDDILYEAQQMEDKEIAEQRTVREKRITLLKAMHLIMLNMNDERAYHTWIISCIPDEPAEADFINTADDDDFFNDVKETFEYIMEEFIKDGLCCE